MRRAAIHYDTADVYQGDCLTVLRELPDQSVNCCITSPPYWGLRDYGVDGQLGLEETPEEYTAKMVEIFREVRRVLRDDGTVWLNLGDSYAATSRGGNTSTYKTSDDKREEYSKKIFGEEVRKVPLPDGIKPKDLVGIPWRVAFALQADGWYLRQDIIWYKPNPMPESVTDRCTKAHEYIFLLTKSARYYYDADVIREEPKPWNAGAMSAPKCGADRVNGTQNQTKKVYDEIKGANRRSVWTVTTKPYSDAHFAVYPPDLIVPCVRAGCPVGGTVLDPFTGSGTTGMVSLENGRKFVGIELNEEYLDMIKKRIHKPATQMRLNL